MNEAPQSINQLTSGLKEDEILLSLLKYAWKQKHAVALWQLPNTDQRHLIIDISNKVSFKGELEEMHPGFLFTPFNESENNYFIKADLTYSTDSNEITLAPDVLNQAAIDRLSTYLAEDINPNYNKSEARGNIASKENYIQLVEESIQKISEGEFIKVVPARSIQIPLTKNFEIAQAFEDLCQKYLNTFISLVSIPNEGTWLGATPELLIRTDSKNTFTTVSLAGTQPFNPEIPLHDMPWTQKEIEEQAIVSRYIINCFKTIRLREFEEEGPKTVKAGNLVHLKTTFTVDMGATNFMNLGSVMLKLLHPTSAVCGMPKDQSLAFLNSREGFDRKFFSGYFGPVNFLKETHLFVNLRCMVLVKDSATLFAGAGVTAYSEPEKEWIETEIKFRTLLDVIEAL